MKYLVLGQVTRPMHDRKTRQLLCNVNMVTIRGHGSLCMTDASHTHAGVVTSVISDSPDDYIALQELKSKPKLREKFHVEDAWVEYDVSTTLTPPITCCS